MRHSCLALAGVFVWCAALSAQQPPPQAPAAPALNPQNHLDSLLMQWEAKMKSVQTLKATISRERDDKVFRTREIFVGEAKYMRPNLALLQMRRKDRPNIYEKYICTGTFLYEYSPDNREIRFHELPPPKPGQVADDNFLSFLFGMRAEEAKRRYELRLVGDGQDKYYHYLEILPRFPADKSDFQKARLVLTQNTMLPRMLTFIEPNGNQVTWDIPVIETGIPLDRREFERPAVPPGWQLKKLPNPNAAGPAPGGDLPPRVVRPKQ